MENNTKRKPLVYLVEDDLDDQYMFKMVLKDLNIDLNLECFEHGLAAYEALTNILSSQELPDKKLPDKALLPDIILLDLNLPVWDGKKTLSVLKKDHRLQAIPIIIYSTSKSEHDVADCYGLGANSFISKAAEFDLLQQQIKTICCYWFSTVLL